MSNIAFTFLNGEGVPVDKYKTLEWLIKCGNRPDKVKELNQEGVHLGEVDKSNSAYGFELCY
jgi:hypothetical protein